MSDGAGQYGNDESCRVKALRAVVLTTPQYEVETGFDFITVDGIEFKDVSGPKGMKLAAGGELAESRDSKDAGRHLGYL